MKNFNYAGLSAKDSTVKDAVKAFRTNGAQVLDVGVDAKEKTRAGVKFKALSFTFADSQRVDLLVKSTGDVFEVKLNGKVTPMRQQDDAAAAVKEIVAKLVAGRDKFTKALTREKAPALPAAKVSRVNQLKGLEVRRDELKGSIASLEAELAA
ncbi:MAG: hypothetical protein RLZZ373_3163 [Pseudomonadota bacterium]|jgi:predicted Rdx family selenoprotein